MRDCEGGRSSNNPEQVIGWPKGQMHFRLGRYSEVILALQELLVHIQPLVIHKEIDDSNSSSLYCLLFLKLYIC